MAHMSQRTKELIPIKTSTFDIPQRLKEIDSGYFVMYNRGRNKFEVHNSKQKDNTLAFDIPWQTLDDRVIELAKKSRTENIKKIIEEMDAHNKKIEEDRTKTFMDKASFKAKDMLKYAEGKTSDVVFKDAYTTRFV